MVDAEDFSTMIARRIAGEIVSIFSSIYGGEVLGPALEEFDLILTELKYPEKNTVSVLLDIYEEIKVRPRDALENPDSLFYKAY